MPAMKALVAAESALLTTARVVIHVLSSSSGILIADADDVGASGRARGRARGRVWEERVRRSLLWGGTTIADEKKKKKEEVGVVVLRARSASPGVSAARLRRRCCARHRHRRPATAAAAVVAVATVAPAPATAAHSGAGGLPQALCGPPVQQLRAPAQALSRRIRWKRVKRD